MRSRILPTFLCFIISACSNKITLPGDYNIQLAPEKGCVEKIDNIKISYIIPVNVLKSDGIDGLVFKANKWGTDTKREMVRAHFDPTQMEVERRTDNGVAGSGLIYSIDIDKIDKDNNRIITFNPKTVKTYQNGLILPFLLPTFDLTSYLASASVVYKFEMISEYPVNSIKANFDRILKSDSSSYQLQLPDCIAVMEVKIYPYRKGSKVEIIANLSKMRPADSVINVSTKIKALEMRIKTIVND